MHEHADHTPEALNPRRAMLAGLGGLAAGAFLASTTNAGPLTPPSGPIQSTPGPEPRIPISPATTPGTSSTIFRITQPGSYYLTGNINAQSGKHGIEIAASGVTLDLNGFELAGVPGSLDGIRTTIASLRSINIHNGSVRNWGGAGINLVTFSIIGGRLEAVHAQSNGSVGLWVGNRCTVNRCTTIGNSATGMITSSDCVITHCIANSNNDGIRSGFGCVVAYCTANFNNATGINMNPNSAVSNCVARSNASDGIAVFSNSLAANNACSLNGTSSGGAGIYIASTNNRVEDNNCTNNDRGIRCIAESNFIARNTCSVNATNWVIAPNNKCLVILGTNAPAINGNSGGTSPGSANPYANFTY